MSEQIIANIRNLIDAHPGFPKPDVVFRDIRPLLASPHDFCDAVNLMMTPWSLDTINKVGAFDARGFLFAGVILKTFKVPCFIIRKKGKTPGDVIGESYNLEYGTDSIEIARAAITPGDRVILVDDVLATGGTGAAGARAAKRLGASYVALTVLIEIEGARGRENLKGVVDEVHSVITY
jgi:adenine phosphoribosyltransferase